MARIPTHDELEKKVEKLEDEVIELKQVVNELHESRDYLKSLFN